MNTTGPLFSTGDLHLICCCALFSNYSPAQVAKLFRGEYTTGSYLRDPDLATVQASDVRACLFYMADTRDHPIYSAWNSIHVNEDIGNVYNTIQPLKEAGEPFRLQYKWNTRRQISEPNWTRHEG